MRTAGLTAGILLAAASIVPASALDHASFTKRLKAVENSIECSGKCFSDGVTRHWQCPTQSDAMVHCELSCNPPRGFCVIEYNLVSLGGSDPQRADQGSAPRSNKKLRYSLRFRTGA